MILKIRRTGVAKPAQIFDINFFHIHMESTSVPSKSNKTASASRSARAAARPDMPVLLLCILEKAPVARLLILCCILIHKLIPLFSIFPAAPQRHYFPSSSSSSSVSGRYSPALTPGPASGFPWTGALKTLPDSPVPQTYASPGGNFPSWIVRRISAPFSHCFRSPVFPA